jgi:hypothetical protein
MINKEIIKVVDVVVVELDSGWYGIGFGCDGDTPLSLATVNVQFNNRVDALEYAINEYLKTGKVENLVLIENDEAAYYHLNDIDKLMGRASNKTLNTEENENMTNNNNEFMGVEHFDLLQEAIHGRVTELLGGTPECTEDDFTPEQYKLAFKTMAKHVRGFAESTNDGSLLMQVVMQSNNDLEESEDVSFLIERALSKKLKTSNSKSNRMVVENTEFNDLEKKYKELETAYKTAITFNETVCKNFDKLEGFYNRLFDNFEKVYAKQERDSYLISLFEHFVSERELEDEFFEFLKNVADNEPVEEYKNAAEWKLNFSGFELNGEMVYHLDCDYGATIEGRGFDEFLTEEKIKVDNSPEKTHVKLIKMLSPEQKEKLLSPEQLEKLLNHDYSKSINMLRNNHVQNLLNRKL